MFTECSVYTIHFKETFGGPGVIREHLSLISRSYGTPLRTHVSPELFMSFFPFPVRFGFLGHQPERFGPRSLMLYETSRLYRTLYSNISF